MATKSKPASGGGAGGLDSRVQASRPERDKSSPTAQQNQHGQPAGCQILDWRPLRKNALRGFARVGLPAGLILNDVAVLVSEGVTPWASPPARPMVDRGGVAIKDAGGRSRYSALVQFADRERRDRWSAAVVEALRHAHPDALA
jgi:hypothetical protein